MCIPTIIIHFASILFQYGLEGFKLEFNDNPKNYWNYTFKMKQVAISYTHRNFLKTLSLRSKNFLYPLLVVYEIFGLTSCRNKHALRRRTYVSGSSMHINFLASIVPEFSTFIWTDMARSARRIQNHNEYIYFNLCLKHS